MGAGKQAGQRAAFPPAPAPRGKRRPPVPQGSHAHLAQVQDGRPVIRYYAGKVVHWPGSDPSVQAVHQRGASRLAVGGWHGGGSRCGVITKCGPASSLSGTSAAFVRQWSSRIAGSGVQCCIIRTHSPGLRHGLVGALKQRNSPQAVPWRGTVAIFHDSAAPSLSQSTPTPLSSISPLPELTCSA